MLDFFIEKNYKQLLYVWPRLISNKNESKTYLGRMMELAREYFFSMQHHTAALWKTG